MHAVAILTVALGHSRYRQFFEEVAQVFAGSISEKFQISRANRWRQENRLVVEIVLSRKVLLYNRSNLLILFDKSLTYKVAPI